MNDRFLFRGKRLNNGEWMTGYLIGGENPNILGVDRRGMAIPVDSDTIGQCTGVCDKLKNLVFEGDIIEFHSPITTSLGGEKENFEYWLEYYGRCVVEFGAYEYQIDCDGCGGAIECQCGNNYNSAYGFYLYFPKTKSRVHIIAGDFSAAAIVSGNVHDDPELMEVKSE